MNVFHLLNFLFLLFYFLDGELEAEWLVSAGFPHLTKAFEEVNTFFFLLVLLHLFLFLEMIYSVIELI